MDASKLQSAMNDVTQKKAPTFSFSELLTQSFLIFLSVVLGLMANEWRQDRAIKKDIDKALYAIQEEIRGNLAGMQRALQYHDQIKGALASLANEIHDQSAKPTPQQLRKALPQGFGVPLIERNAWDVLNFTGLISELDYEWVSELSRLYSHQSFYHEKLDKVGDNLYIASNMHPEHTHALTLALSLLANDIVIQEKRLTDKYQTILTKLAALDIPTPDDDGDAE